MSALHVVAAITADAANYKARAQDEAEMRQIRLHQAAVFSEPRVKPTPTKCACCGSHEFRVHAGRTICAYCRTDGR